MRWNIGDNTKLFLKLEPKFGLFHVVLTAPKTFTEKLKLTVVEMQQLPDIGKTDSKEYISCLKRTICNCRKQVCVKFNADRDNFKFFVYRYQNNFYLKDKELD